MLLILFLKIEKILKIIERKNTDFSPNLQPSSARYVWPNSATAHAGEARFVRSNGQSRLIPDLYKYWAVKKNITLIPPPPDPLALSQSGGRHPPAAAVAPPTATPSPGARVASPLASFTGGWRAAQPWRLSLLPWRRRWLRLSLSPPLPAMGREGSAWRPAAATPPFAEGAADKECPPPPDPVGGGGGSRPASQRPPPSLRIQREEVSDARWHPPFGVSVLSSCVDEICSCSCVR